MWLRKWPLIYWTDKDYLSNILLDFIQDEILYLHFVLFKERRSIKYTRPNQIYRRLHPIQNTYVVNE